MAPSVRLSLPRIIAPAAFSFATTVASRRGQSARAPWSPHRPHATCVTEILHGDGNAVQRPAIRARVDFPFGPGCRGDGLIGHHGCVTREPRVDLRNAIEHLPRERDGRDLS